MRKKLFAILMSAMMMVTFMPAMAFAATAPHFKVSDATWNEDFTAATVTVQELNAQGTYDTLGSFTTTNISYSFNDVNGMVHAEAAWPVDKYGQITKEANFYDLTGAEVTAFMWDGDAVKNVEADEYLSLIEDYEYTFLTLAGDTIKLKKPAYCTNVSKSFAEKTINNGILQYAVVYNLVPYEKYDDCTLTLPINVATDAQVAAKKIKTSDDPTYGGCKTLQDLLDKNAGVDGIIGSSSFALGIFNNEAYDHAKISVSDATYVEGGKTLPVEAYLDTDLGDVTKLHNFTYDGNEHTVAVEPLKNVKVEYRTVEREKNEVVSKGEYSETAPVVKAAGTYYYDVKLTATNRIKPTPVEFKVRVIVDKKPATVGFKQDVMKVAYGDVKDVVDVFRVDGVVDADAAAFAAMASKLYVVDGFFTEVGAKRLTLAAAAKPELTDAEKAVYDNYTFAAEAGHASMWLEITQADNEVTCPTTNKTVKYSKVKKAAQKVTVKTTSKFGEVKLTKVSGSANLKVQAGKIVVKKGTKKGTYKIKVRASVVGTANYAGAKITKTITIRVK